MSEHKIIPSKPNSVCDDLGNHWHSIRSLSKELHVHKHKIGKSLKEFGFFKHQDRTYTLSNSPRIEIKVGNSEDNTGFSITEEEYNSYKIYTSIKNSPFEKIDIKFKSHKKGLRYAVALFSDAHIEETVALESVLGKNEYNVSIAEERIKNYFNNLATCLNKDNVDELIFASLGDTISGYIHDELSQTNGLTPTEATIKAQSLIYHGLDFLCRQTKIKSIKFIGIVGNHSRTTKKIQHSNGFKLSYEWIMYQNIKSMCTMTHLPIDFIIPESEMAITDMPDGKRFIFIHGYQIKSGGSGTVCGIYPALNRLSMKWDRTFKQDKIYLGHFHSCVSIPNAVVNGSIIGFNSFALSNGFTCEEPAQMYEVYDTERGLLLTRKIYCD